MPDPKSSLSIAEGDVFYERLMAAHQGLSEEESHALNVRLVLLMASEISDITTLEAIIDEATST